ncbi:MAG TPA: LapA family protein [Acidimicrobiia bacterium]|nr:LapA family protein [Acidimicrobiia bacterium]
MATRSGSSSQSGTGSSRAQADTNGSSAKTGTTASSAKAGTGNSGAKTGGASTARRRTRTSEASAAGATARARINSARARGRAASRPKKDDIPIVDPSVPADDSVLAATNAQRALSPDMPRVAWLRSQLMQMEQRQRDRLVKVAQLTAIAIIFITFVLQNAQGVNVHLLLFSVNIRLIWVIFGCALLGGVAGYLIGRPDKSLRALLPQKQRKPDAGRRGTTAV